MARYRLPSCVAVAAVVAAGLVGVGSGGAPAGAATASGTAPTGNVYIADTHNGRVVEVPAGGGPQTTVGSGLYNPTGVTADAAGDLYIADYGNNRVVEVPAGGSPQITIASGLSSPAGVAVDGSGNVYISDYGSTQVVEVPAGGGPQTTIASGLSHPAGVAVDAAGDVFIADYGNSRVVEVPAGGGPQITIGSGLYNPKGVAVDAAGDVYIADTGNTRVVEVPAGGGPQITVASGLSFPQGVAVDAAGNAFIADTTTNRVVEVPAGGGPQTTIGSGLSFPDGVAVGPPLAAQTITVTSDPGAPQAGSSYTPVVSSSSGLPVTITVAAASSAVCHVAGGQVHFDTAGACAIRYDQPGDAAYFPAAQVTQDVTVTRAAQTITVTSDPGTPQAGSSYTPVVSSSSGLPVTITVAAASSAVCHVAGGQVHFDTAGDCSIRYDQPGDADYLPAGQVSQDVTVAAIPTSVAVSFDPGSPVFGQPVTAQMTSSDTGTGAPLDGTVTVTVAGTQLASVPTTGGAAAVPLTTAAGEPLSAGSYPVEVQFTPTDATHAPAQTSSTLTVDPAGTTTTLAITGTRLTATVTPAAPSGPAAGTPTGQVSFAVAGSSVGTATLHDGVATLQYVLPHGAARAVSAVYSGAPDWAASSASTSRTDPAITARLSSPRPRNRAGWYRTPVTVTFTCTTHGADLTRACPKPVQLRRNAGGQTVSRVITATDGGAATVTVTGIDIDRTAPRLHLTGIHPGATYAAAPAQVCHATDTVSGIAACRITTRVIARRAAATVYAYRAVATDRAGNQHTVTDRYRLLTATFDATPYQHGAFTVHPGHIYTLVIDSRARPTYYDAAVYPRRPTHRDPQAFQNAGPHRWALGITMTRSLRSHPLWNIGIKTYGTLHILRIRIA